MTFVIENHELVSVSGSDMIGIADNFEISVENAPVQALINTGESGIILFIIASLALMMTAFVIKRHLRTI